jgi:hypothetical protein
MVRPLALCLLLAAPAAGPAAAEDPASPEIGEGVDLIERGARLLFDGLVREMAPARDEMGRSMAELQPAVRELMGMIEDFANYEFPERLPNGDIIIRRKPDAPPLPPAGVSVDL